MGKINREDMLELTRRMTIKRNCFSRLSTAFIQTSDVTEKQSEMD